MAVSLSNASEQSTSQGFDSPSIESELPENQLTALKAQGTNRNTKNLRHTSKPMVHSGTSPLEIQAQASQRGIKTHLQEKDINKRTRRSTVTKRKIFDEHIEVSNGLAVNAVGMIFKAIFSIISR